MNILDKEDILMRIPESLRNDFVNNALLVETNIKYLKELDISNYEEIFVKYYPMFLMDASNFRKVFSKYDQNDLLEKINKNMTIIEHL